MSAPEVQDLHERLPELIESGELSSIRSALDELHPSDIADLIESLDTVEERFAVMRLLPAEAASETLAEMEEGEDRADLLAALAPEKGAELIHELADDDAADLVGELNPEARAALLAQLPADEAGDIRDLLVYEEETAGSIMTAALVSVRGQLSASEAIQQVRVQGREVEDFFSVFVVDEVGRLLGTVPLDDLVVAEPDERVEHLVEPIVASVTPDIDQEDVGKLMSRYNVVSLPVLDHRGVLLGRITFDDVIDVIEAEQTEDILLLAGVSDEEELRGDWTDALRVRLPWLFLNLVTAAIAASVVLVFADTIDRIWVLAAIMPVIAGMGGNAGTQALAVTVRRLAVAQGPLERDFDAVGKEALVGLVAGLALGIAAAVVATGLAYVVDQDLRLGLVVLFAMWGNLLVAGFAGAFIPTVLDRMKIDPAVASSVFVTTFTDLFGFFLLLGLASAVLL